MLSYSLMLGEQTKLAQTPLAMINVAHSPSNRPSATVYKVYPRQQVISSYRFALVDPQLHAAFYGCREVASVYAWKLLMLLRDREYGEVFGKGEISENFRGGNTRQSLARRVQVWY